MPVCARKQTNGPPGADWAFLQPAATAAMHCHLKGWGAPTPPPPPPPPFLLFANTKPFLKMDCAN